MANVAARLFITLRKLAGKKQTEVRSAILVKIVERVVEKYGSKFRDKLLDEKIGRTKPFYSILVNSIRLSLREDTETKAKDGDVIAIFPLAGGW